MKRIAALAAIAAAIAVASADATLGARGGAAAQTDAPESFTADVSIGQTQVEPDGRPLPGAAPPVKYRFEQRATTAGVSAVLAVVDVRRDSAEGATGVAAVDNPFLAVRMESDPNGALRLYNARGQVIRGPAAADRRLFASADGTPRPRVPGRTRPNGPAARAFERASGLLAAAGAAGDRRADLVRRFGPSRDRVRGFDRYVSTRQNDVDEILVDPATALPTEQNTMRGGRLVARVQMEYAAHGDGVFVRRWCRAEHIVPDSTRRIVTTIDVSNVRVTIGGGR